MYETYIIFQLLFYFALNLDLVTSISSSSTYQMCSLHVGNESSRVRNIMNLHVSLHDCKCSAALMVLFLCIKSFPLKQEKSIVLALHQNKTNSIEAKIVWSFPGI